LAEDRADDGLQDSDCPRQAGELLLVALQFADLAQHADEPELVLVLHDRIELVQHGAEVGEKRPDRNDERAEQQRIDRAEWIEEQFEGQRLLRRRRRGRGQRREGVGSVRGRSVDLRLRQARAGRRRRDEPGQERREGLADRHVAKDVRPQGPENRKRRERIVEAVRR
jgi:hypothetical protein